MAAMQERISSVLADQFKVAPDLIAPEVTFGELKFDSLVLIELTLALEGELGITIDDGELTAEMTIDDAAELLAARGAEL
jgi:acyl carrier protein